MDDSKIILSTLKMLQGDQKAHRDEMNQHQLETVSWHARAEERLGNIEGDLREHKEGVIQNRDSFLLIDKRTTELERPITVKTVAKNIGMVGVVISCMLAALKLYTVLKI